MIQCLVDCIIWLLVNIFLHKSEIYINEKESDIIYSSFLKINCSF